MTTHTLHRSRTVAVLLALLILLPLIPGHTAVAQNKPANQQSGWITPRGGQPFFVVGANYEGATDRAWMMWESDKFDPSLIAADFARARSIGINTVRIFVQRPLRDDANRNDFSKLDAVTELARRNNLWLILTFTDWPEPDLTKSADLNLRIAAHLAGEPSILAYDVKNEPQFTDVAGAIFPANTAAVPLQDPATLATYGEKVKRSDIATYRRNQGNYIPARMNDDQAYLMANYYELYRDFLDAGAAWVGSHPNSTTLDYMDSPDSASWQPFLSAIDATLLAWVNTQVDPVRAADPGRPITVGYSNIVFAKLPSNRALDFQSIHRFTSHGYSGLNATFLVLNNLQRTFAGEPVLLEEFGYPGQVKGSGDTVVGFDPRTTANLEAAAWAFLYANGFAGGAKWMLNNFPQGYDPAQNSFGLFDNSGQPKIAARTLGQISSLFSHTSAGTFSGIRAADASAVSYSYNAADALIAGGKEYAGPGVTYNSTFPSTFVMSSARGAISLFATDTSTATLDIPALLGVPTASIGRISLSAVDPQGQGVTPSLPTLAGDLLTVSLKGLYSYRLVAIPGAIDPAPPTPGIDAVFFPQTSHNLTGDFLTYWQQNGGLRVFGYPVSEPFVERGNLVQYFERNRFELHPENQPPYNVLLGRLGADAVAPRVFPTIAPFDSAPDHLYFPETGHSLNFAFLGYWNRNGGLAQFGFPISEELHERSATDGKEYIVQYFERARFEYHPEYKGTDAEVLLGLLGINILRTKGWLP
ncbi:MAG: hypothetical protein ABI670_12125 [Chloroflexota bacterium]